MAQITPQAETPVQKPDPIDTSAIGMEGVLSANAGGGLFCGVTEEQFAINGVTYQWPKGSHLKWGMEFSRLGGITGDDLISAIKEFLKEIAGACNATFEYVQGQMSANIWLTAKRLDGPSGVLADMQIPTNARVDRTQLLGRFDDSENWVLADNPPAGTIDFYRVGLHEWLHAMGLGHRPPSVTKPALIAPLYSPVMRHLQKADIDELVRRYETPQTPVVPPTTGVRKSVNFKADNAELEQDGRKWRANITGVFTPVN